MFIKNTQKYNLSYNPGQEETPEEAKAFYVDPQDETKPAEDTTEYTGGISA